MSNSKQLNCKECGEPTVASMEAVTVLCGKCTAAGKSIKTYFKDKKLNDEIVKQGGTKKTVAVKEVAPEAKEPGLAVIKGKRFGQVKYIVKQLNAGKSIDDVIKSIRKDLPLYTAPDKTIRIIYSIQKSKLKGGK